MDLVIEGRFLIDGELKETAVGIENGKIATIGKIVRGGDLRIESKNGVIMPGFVDPHVHFRDPGMTKKEDFASGTLSALHGGVTAILDMPNTSPPVIDIKTLAEKKRTVSSKAYVDYGLFAALTPSIKPEMLASHVAGFKLFMGSTTGNILMNNDDDIHSVLPLIHKTGKVLSVHAEDDSLIKKDEEKDGMDHLRNRPAEAERNAVERLSKYRGMKINICHMTDVSALAIARKSGFTTEVTLHHMMFSAEDNAGTIFKVNPPIRNRQSRNQLVEAVKRGEVSMIGSDHAPHTAEEKSQDYGSAPSGIASVETTIPILMRMAMKGLFPLQLLSSMGSTIPAKTFGMNKGKIAVGYDADFVIFDNHKIKKIDIDGLHSKAGTTPYQGMEAMFPETVILRGNIQIEDGEYCGGRIGRDMYGN